MSALAFLFAPGSVTIASAQVAPDETWRTFHTPHFRIHFPAALESIARRAAEYAERGYANLATELVEPRGKIELVLTDAIDGSNGSATVFPRNQVVIQLRPPVDVSSLASYDDWLFMVIQHELTHIFHIDRTRGLWQLGQRVFGRHPAMFPNSYAPSWLTEGLAVYYESRFTQGGRLDGTYFYALSDAAARDYKLPPLDALSLATSRYPGGLGAYLYGSLIVNDLAERSGEDAIPQFVERSSATFLPLLLDRTADQAFGVTFTAAWNRWRDSVMRAAPASARPAPTWRTLPARARSLQFPRWENDNAVLYAADNGRETPALYRVTLEGDIQRLGRRTALDVNAPGADGRVVFAQLEYADRFRIRSDLYATQYGRTRRLTFNQRLSAPDVRADGEIVAVQTAPATTVLARVSRDGRHVVPITYASPDTQWTAPRWSPDGQSIAAVRIGRGLHEIVVTDPRGIVSRVVGNLTGMGGTVRALAWAPDGKGVYATIDRGERTAVYYVNFDTQTASLAQHAESSLDLYGLDVRALPGSTVPRLASVFLQSDGMQLAEWTPVGATVAPAASPEDTVVRASAPPWPYQTMRSTSYTPWRSLLPRYWSPILDGSGESGMLIGLLTSGNDVVRRHAYDVQGYFNVRSKHIDAYASYQYNRFRKVSLDFSAEQTWSYTTLYSGANQVGVRDRRARLYAARATFARPRMTQYSALILGFEHETREYVTRPDSLLAQLAPFYQQKHSYPTLLAGVQFSNTQRPTLSISPEDGIAASLTIRQRQQDGVSRLRALNIVGVTSLYKSLDFPGFSHHVLAARVAAGVTNSNSPTRYSVGGISGGSLQVLPGFSLGDQARMFPLRGFAPSVQQGVRAVAATVEYRAPLMQAGRGLGLFPLFLDRTSITLFSDAGRAYCPGVSAPGCTAENFGSHTLASVGGELNFDTALQYDVGYRVRAGLARPVRNGETVRQTGFRAYVTIGAFF